MTFARKALAGLAAACMASTALAGPVHRGPVGLQFLGPPPVVSGNFDTNPGFIVPGTAQIGTAASTALGGVADSHKTTFAWWSLATFDPTSLANITNSAFISSLDTGGCEAGSAPNTPFVCLAYVDNSHSGNYAQLNINFGTGATGADFAYDNANIPGVWTFNLVTVDTDNQVGAAYRGRTKVDQGPTIASAGNIAWTSANGFGVMNRGGSGVKYMAMENVYASTESMACITTADLVLNGNHFPCPGGANTIPPTLLDKFIDAATGKAISLGTNGSVVTGRQPEVLLSGDSTTAATNKGFATGIALRAASGNTAGDQAIWDNLYGPGLNLIAHRPTPKFMVAANKATGTDINCVSTACTFVVSTAQQPVAVGDTLVLVTHVQNQNITADPATTCPSGWTSQATSYDNNQTIRTQLCTLVAAGATNSWTVSFTGSVANNTASWEVFDYLQVASIDLHTCSVQASASTWNTPGGNTASNNETVLSTYSTWDWSGRQFTNPSSTTIRWKPPQFGTAGATDMVTENFYASSGTATAKSATFVTGSDSGVACTLGLVG